MKFIIATRVMKPIGSLRAIKSVKTKNGMRAKTVVKTNIPMRETKIGGVIWNPK